MDSVQHLHYVQNLYGVQRWRCHDIHRWTNAILGVPIPVPIAVVAGRGRPSRRCRLGGGDLPARCLGAVVAGPVAALAVRRRHVGELLPAQTYQPNEVHEHDPSAAHRVSPGGRPMITIESVTKKYGAFTAVDDVSFTAQSGRVTGFLGPNGAGKSTTMRIIVGLTRANSGTAMVSGRHYVDLPNPGLEVGVLLDASAQHAGRTGREILTIAQRFMGLPRNRVEEMLEVVSLTPNEASRRVRNYSLGMRQRLGIATALIGDPEVLVLDEPANGLDPAGIRWMRDLLRGYADRGGTVLLSSHLLHEIEVIADDIVMIGNGRIVSQGTKAELLRTGGTVVRAHDMQDLEDGLRTAGIATSYDDQGALHAEVDPGVVGLVAREYGLALTELRAAEGGLEDLFLQLTAHTQREGKAA